MFLTQFKPNQTTINYKYTGDQSNRQITVLKCVFCKKLLPLNDFSDVNQQKAGLHKPNEIRYKRKNQSLISCKKCTPHPNGKLFCNGCEIKKPLQEFSKVQRKNIGNSYCAKCIQEERSEIGWSSDSD